ncbi:hypothetical protein GQ53DRAFT_241724 [Thozetella sp. PMI_491]|nr:hypothetical protein GQ53DRAFT_241724 [Thozetella sp. PMI_491]
MCCRLDEPSRRRKTKWAAAENNGVGVSNTPFRAPTSSAAPHPPTALPPGQLPPPSPPQLSPGAVALVPLIGHLLMLPSFHRKAPRLACRNLSEEAPGPVASPAFPRAASSPPCAFAARLYSRSVDKMANMPVPAGAFPSSLPSPKAVWTDRAPKVCLGDLDASSPARPLCSCPRH